MNEDLVNDLKYAIRKLKLEILKKEKELDNLVLEYQELTGEEVED